mmetsp:Transcript_24594/g.70636  ORF Transcript_24594/g.70636 Transcript_24594/m.70636 type:complete len:260 (-) Transcript_24594:1492-2271(-)
MLKSKEVPTSPRARDEILATAVITPLALQLVPLQVFEAARFPRESDEILVPGLAEVLLGVLVDVSGVDPPMLELRATGMGTHAGQGLPTALAGRKDLLVPVVVLQQIEVLPTILANGDGVLEQTVILFHVFGLLEAAPGAHDLESVVGTVMLDGLDARPRGPDLDGHDPMVGVRLGNRLLDDLLLIVVGPVVDHVVLELLPLVLQGLLLLFRFFRDELPISSLRPALRLVRPELKLFVELGRDDATAMVKSPAPLVDLH